jgi:hypothetical protein
MEESGHDLKMTVFWDVARVFLQKLNDVSEVLTASIIRAMSQARRRANLKSHGQYLI